MTNFNHNYWTVKDLEYFVKNGGILMLRALYAL